jgi:hypothetical protein
MKIEESVDSTNQEASKESVAQNIVATLKPFLFGVTALAFLMAIWVLLPMFLTYLSEGDARPPSQIHHADPLGKKNPNDIYKGL